MGSSLDQHNINENPECKFEKKNKKNKQFEDSFKFKEHIFYLDRISENKIVNLKKTILKTLMVYCIFFVCS